MSLLTLQIRQREGRNQWYVDFLIDGISLYDLLRPNDMVSCLGWPDSGARKAAACLLLNSPSDLESGRIELYVCGECGDTGCGAITAHIALIDGDMIRWSDFGYENNYDPSDTDTESYVSTGPFTFDLHQYREAIKSRWDSSRFPPHLFTLHMR